MGSKALIRTMLDGSNLKEYSSPKADPINVTSIFQQVTLPKASPPKIDVEQDVAKIQVMKSPVTTSLGQRLVAPQSFITPQKVAPIPITPVREFKEAPRKRCLLEVEVHKEHSMAI